MADQMPPTSNADPLEKRTVALPPSLWESCEKLAAVNGEKLSEFYRRIMTLGISAEKERRTADMDYQNKEFINERLKAKVEGAVEALEALEGVASDLDIGMGGSTEELLGIAARFRAWLRE